MGNKFDKKRLIKASLYLILGIISCLSTNSNPVIFMERIFMPIKLGSATIYYAGVFSIVFVYKGIKLLAETFEWKLHKEGFLLFLLTIMVVVLIRNLCIDVIRASKSYSKGLSSIYCEYEQQGLFIEEMDDKKAKINVEFDLENLSSEKRQFSIRIKTPKHLKENFDVDEFAALDSQGKIATYYIEGKSKKQIDVEILFDFKNSKELNSRWTEDFEFFLYNDKESLRFGKRYIWSDLLINRLSKGALRYGLRESQGYHMISRSQTSLTTI